MEPLQYEVRGYLREPFRLFHLADGRREHIEYHIIRFIRSSFCWQGRRATLSRASGTI